MSLAVIDKILSTKRLILKPPKFMIAGVPVDIQYMPWWFTLGSMPYMVDVEMSDNLANEIWERTGGDAKRIKTKIEFEYESLLGKFKGGINNIYVMERKHPRRMVTMLSLCDPRILWVRRIAVGRFNYKRRVNELHVVEDKKIHNVFRDYFLYQGMEYFPWSCKDSETTPPTPWRAIDLLDMLAKRYLGEWDIGRNEIKNSFFGGWYQNGRVVSVDKVRWSNAAPDDITFDGRNLLEVVNYLLYLSRTNMAFFPDGKCYFFKTADDNIVKRLPVNYSQYTDISNTFIYKSRKKRWRPSCYYVYSDKVFELPCEYDHAKQLKLVEDYKKSRRGIPEERKIRHYKGKIENIPAQKPWREGVSGSAYEETASKSSGDMSVWADKFDPTNTEKMFDKADLINVAPMPMNYTTAAGTFMRNEWVPVQILIEAAGLTEEIIRENWYDNVWQLIFWTNRYIKYVKEHVEEEQIDEETLRKIDKKGQLIVKAIAQNFWKTFMLHPKYRQRLVDFDTVRADVYNRPTGYQVPSYAFLNYIDSPSIMAYIRNNKVVPPQNYNADIGGMTIEEILRLGTSPFTLSRVDTAGGPFIFRLSQALDRQDVHYAFTEGTLDVLPEATPQATKDNQNWLDSNKIPMLRMVCLISVKPAVPNNKAIMHITKVLPSSRDKGDGNPHEINQRREPARFAWNDNMQNVREIQTGNPINESLISNITKTEAALKNFEMRDWFIGQMRLAGIHQTIKPFGNATIGWEFGTAECHTVINMSQPPKAGDPYDWATPDMRKALWRELDKKK